jgi:hypothetical protein
MGDPMSQMHHLMKRMAHFRGALPARCLRANRRTLSDALRAATYGRFAS